MLELIKNVWTQWVGILKGVRNLENTTYNYTTMGLKRGRGSNFWNVEKETKLIEMLNKGAGYKDVGLALGATRGQIATKVRSLRKQNISIKGVSKVKTGKIDKASKVSKKVSKKVIKDIIKEI